MISSRLGSEEKMETPVHQKVRGNEEFIRKRVLCATENLVTDSELTLLTFSNEPLNVSTCNPCQSLEFYEVVLLEEKHFPGFAFTYRLISKATSQ